MSDKSSTTSGGIGLGSLLLVLFVALKLCGVIGWSWWWVTAPIWMPLAIVLGIVALFAVIAGICMIPLLLKGGGK